MQIKQTSVSSSHLVEYQAIPTDETMVLNGSADWIALVIVFLYWIVKNINSSNFKILSWATTNRAFPCNDQYCYSV